MRTFVVGTAGHVDHGKSTLVRQLTGIDPDRLQEEKDREMTIDLGFAWLDLPDGTRMSIVDVPGHERFIKNMLAGVGGIDAAVLVIAADEGPMPQTAEHLAIIDLLGIELGVIALTKCDLVDKEWLELVTEEVIEAVAGTTLEGASLYPVSAKTGEGVQALLDGLQQIRQELPERQPTGRPRISVDRVFSVAGFGTVITGTLLGDALSVGMEMELLPSGRKTRVRGLQVHGAAVEQALPGSRTAVNLTGIDRDEVRRGDLLATPDWIEPTTMLDAQIRLISSAPKPLEQNQAIDFFSGAAEMAGYVTLLDSELIAPGDSGWVQIRFADPVAAVDGDVFIIRQPSPSLTIGGGTIVNTQPYRHRRFRENVINELETRLTGTPLDRLEQIVLQDPAALRDIARQLELSDPEAIDIVNQGVIEDRLFVPGVEDQSGISTGALVWSSEKFKATADSLVSIVNGYQTSHPLRPGMPKQELRSRSNLGPREFDSARGFLVTTNALVDVGNIVKTSEYTIQLTEDQQRKADVYVAALDNAPNSPPSPGEFGIDQELLAAMDETGLVVRISDNVVFSPRHLQNVRAETLEIIASEGEITLARFRDHFGSSRKYAQAVLEYFDQQRFTRRVGDVRVAGNG